MKCPHCGAERYYIGVRYPIRALCSCENVPCDVCEAPAIAVEFQGRVKTEEPVERIHYCGEHTPEPVTPEAPPVAPGPKKRERNPSIDPAWTAATPPPQLNSPSRVQCFSCGDRHQMKQRKMFNGTQSNCPKCGDGMYTLDMESAT